MLVSSGPVHSLGAWQHLVSVESQGLDAQSSSSLVLSLIVLPAQTESVMLAHLARAWQHLVSVESQGLDAQSSPSLVLSLIVVPAQSESVMLAHLARAWLRVNL